MADDRKQRVLVWDIPTRLFHWALVLLITFSYTTAKLGDDWLQLHLLSGYCILTLLLYRIAWGFVGSTTARFSDFVKGPSHAFAHLADLLGRDKPREAGHNPLGGAMVVALLVAVLVQVATGLFSSDTDTGLVSGPLANLIPDKWVERLTNFHHLWINLILVMVAIHVLAAVTYLVWKRQNLIASMFHGHKPVDDVVPPGRAVPELVFASCWRALAVLVAAAAVVYLIVRFG